MCASSSALIPLVCATAGTESAISDITVATAAQRNPFTSPIRPPAIAQPRAASRHREYLATRFRARGALIAVPPDRRNLPPTTRASEELCLNRDASARETPLTV